MKPLTLALTGLCLMMLSACSEPPKTEEKAAAPAKPKEPVTGLDALYQMYRSARGVLGGDTEVLTLNSIHLTDVKAEPGKAAAWQCSFASHSAGKARTYTYSVIEAEGNLHQGVFGGTEESWSPTRGPKSFPMSAVKVDSSAAYQTALKKSAEYDKKNPGKTISFLLERTENPNAVAWRVIWGESAGTSSFSVLVDATTGDYIKTLH